jgi:hypothetical protein
MYNVAAFAFVNFTYELFDSGLANVLGLETLNHGTNPVNYLNIKAVGGDPSQGAKKSGSTVGWIFDRTQNYFYLFKDDELRGRLNLTIEPDHDLSERFCLVVNRVFSTKGMGNRILPRLHAFLSGFNFVRQIFPDTTDQSSLIKYPAIFFSCVGGAFSAIVSPTIRFRFSKIDPIRLEDDPAYFGLAYRTRQAIEPWRIGLLGSLLVGVNLEWFSRVQAKPIKFLTGVVQLTCATAILVLSVNFFLNNPAFILASTLIN